jgi:hypothetical protein
MGVRLEDLAPGALSGGLARDAVVTRVAVRWVGSSALQLTYRTGDGRLGERLLYRDHRPRLMLRLAAIRRTKRASKITSWHDGSSISTAFDYPDTGKGGREPAKVIAPVCPRRDGHSTWARRGPERRAV